MGTLALCGALMFSINVPTSLGATEIWLWLAMRIIAPAGTGALITCFAPLKPWREPLIAGVLTIIGWLAIDVGFDIGWFEVDVRLGLPLQPWLTMVVGWTLMLVSAVAGSWAVHRFRATLPPGPFLIVVLSGLTIYGVFALARPLHWSANSDWFSMLLSLLVVGVGSFLAQWVLARPNPWLCGAGTLLLTTNVIVRALNSDASFISVFKHLPGAGISIAIGAGFAHIAWALKVRLGHRVQTDLPPARIE